MIQKDIKSNLLIFRSYSQKQSQFYLMSSGQSILLLELKCTNYSKIQDFAGYACNKSKLNLF